MSLGVRLSATVFRAHAPAWSYRPLSGAGAALYGGRFNPAGTEALYTSLTPMTAWREAQQGFPLKAQPMLLCAYDVDCDDVADLTDPAILQQLGISPADLACAWEAQLARGETPVTWTIAKRLVGAGYAAIKVRSFAPGALADDCNVVFWQWDSERHRVRVIDDYGRLPRDAASWLR